MNKKRQHYIWKYYLKPWTVDNKIWCVRDHKIFKTALENIGVENYFYEAIPLNDVETKVINSLIMQFHPSTHNLLRHTFGIYLSSSNNSDYLRKNGIEEYHCLIEQQMTFILQKLYDKDITFFENEKEKADFSFFIGSQYSRTNKIRNKMNNIFENINYPPEILANIDPNKMSRVIPLIFAENIGNWVYSSSKIKYLENTTSVNFITCDQPIYNIKATPNEMPIDFEIYYPLSPKLAIILTENETEFTILTENDINKYNDFIVNSSHEQIYGLSEYDLSKFV